MFKRFFQLSSVFLITFLLTYSSLSRAQNSVAREWNDVLLESIRDDYARPTVHARNLFHSSSAMYDAWAVFDDNHDTYLLGKTLGDFTCEFNGIDAPDDVNAAREEAISYAMYRLIEHRFENSPNAAATLTRAIHLMSTLGFDHTFLSSDYSTGSYAALGNSIAECYINYGLLDGANELGQYGNLYYQPVNPTLLPVIPGNPNIFNPNLWQPLTLDLFIDQSGNIIPMNTPEFLSPEWGNVLPFSLQEADKTVYQNEGIFYNVYHDPGQPPYIDEEETREEYIWNFMLVSVWGSHLDPDDGVMIDVSPASIGNNPEFPTTIPGLRDFYNLEEGGDQSRGWDENPVTNQPYAPQMVPRGDYGRILAEFWADGPDSETPPGHWFTILNYVNDHPLTVKKFRGEGDVLDDLEWDVKSYFIMGGTMHDAAITAWGIKGWYDYIRPISAIRYMGDQGQSSDTTKSNYSERGLPLIEGLIEMVEAGDTLVGESSEHLNKLKVKSWRGPDHIGDPLTEYAGVGWILAENWWPYQRPTFVTPPFAGYVSGHSTYSRAAAEAMTLLTGDAFFPGGMGEFEAPMNEFLVFEDGPSMDVTLQWATYRDASDQCSLSRIWGGIHPPADDIPGRLMGEKLGIAAFEYAEQYFDINTAVYNNSIKPLDVYPNPINLGDAININLPHNISQELMLEVINAKGELFQQSKIASKLKTNNLTPGMYILKLSGNGDVYQTSIVVQ